MKSEVVNIPLDKLVIAEYSPRILAHRQAVKELAENIKRTGVISPIHVRRRDDGKYEIFSGSIRYRALKTLGKNEAPCIIHDVDVTEAKKLALVEAVLHEEHAAEEIAMYVRRLLREKVFSSLHEMAMFLGKTEKWLIELKKAMDELEELRYARELQARPESREHVTFQIARELARKPEEVKRQFVREIASPRFAEWARVAAPELKQKVLKDMAGGARFDEALKLATRREEIRQVKFAGKEYAYEAYVSGDEVVIHKLLRETLKETLTIPRADLRLFLKKLEALL